MLSAKDVAEYFLVAQEEEAGERITNLKLQKLCYYAQGFSLAILERPMFRDKIKAWTHGPVVDSLYEEYKEYGDAPIPIPNGVDLERFDEETRSILDDVATVYGQFSGWKLRRMTHEEPPWRDARAKLGHVISQKAMKVHFATLVEAA